MFNLSHVKHVLCRLQTTRTQISTEVVTPKAGQRMMMSSMIYAQTIPKRKRQDPAMPLLTTLRPERIVAGEQQLCDLSGRKYPRLYEVDYRVHGYSGTRVTYGTFDDVVHPFPPNTRGYFYYHNPPHLPELAAGIRFKLCGGPESFNRGCDLLTPTGTPWGITLPHLVSQSQRTRLVALLRTDNLVNKQLVEDILKLKLSNRPAAYLYSLADPFVVDLSVEKTHCTVINRKWLCTIRYRPFLLRYGFWLSTMHYPLKGTVRLQFELTNTPMKCPSLVARVLDIIKPISMNPEYHGTRIAIPKPGDLLYKMDNSGDKRILYIPIHDEPDFRRILQLAKQAWPQRSAEIL